MFTFAIFCLITFNLPWFTDLTFLCNIVLYRRCHQVASVVSDSVRPHGLQPTRLLCPWDSPGKNTGVGCQTLTKGHIHNWALFPLWLSCFILSGAISNCSLFFLSSILDTFQSGGLIFWFHIFCLFILFMGFSPQEYWSGLPFPSPLDHILSELSTVTRPSWLALRGRAHSFIDLCKPLCHDKAVICEGSSWALIYPLLLDPLLAIPRTFMVKVEVVYLCSLLTPWVGG